MIPSNIKVPNPPNPRLLNIRIDIKTADPDQFSTGKYPPQPFANTRKAINAAIPLVNSPLHEFKSFPLCLIDQTLDLQKISVINSHQLNPIRQCHYQN